MIIQFLWCGNMGKIILQAAIWAGIDTKDIFVQTKTLVKSSSLKEKYKINIWLHSHADVVILAIKPQQINEINLQFFRKDALFISIMAGAQIKTIQEKILWQKIIRAMPNTPAQVWCWVIWYICTSEVLRHEMQTFIDIFDHTWTLIPCRTEDEIDKITALSWSWPAYYYLFTEIMEEKARKMWLSEHVSSTLAKNVFIWASQLLQASRVTPHELRKNITSPGGTTEVAIRNFMEHWFQQIIEQSIEKAYQRAQELHSNP